MADDQKSGEWKSFRTFFRRFFLTVGVLTTLSFGLAVFAVSRAMDGGASAMPEKILLTFNFKSTLPEEPAKPSLTNPALHGGPTFRQVARALEAAAKDPRVKGFAAKIDGAHLAVAQDQELRDAIHRFRKAGKFTHIYSESFGGGGSGMGDYYLASAFDDIWLQPIGILAINGVGAEIPFAKDFLDKIGVQAQFNHKGIYKSMPESLTRTGMSAPNREMMTSLINDLAAQMQDGISADRKIAPAELAALIDRAPLGDTEALKANLVDHIGYADEMLDAAKKQAGVSDDGVVTLGNYDPPARAKGDGKKIALITGSGDIVSSGGPGGLSADHAVAAFRAAMKDKDVAAVVFRVDSPGGSPEAAESIRHAVTEMQKKGRPVVVSMGGYAASGGYWVATHADKIVAEPGTITGSIGVFGGKIVLAGLWEKLGLNWDSVAVGKNALMWSVNRPFSTDEAARFEQALENIYDGFIARVAEGRHMTKAKAESVAEGRVWTGRQAKDRGLVDELGGLDLAITRAKELAKLDPAKDIPVVDFPAPKSPLEVLLSFAKNDDEDAAILRLDLTDIMKSALQNLRAQNAAVLRMPYVVIN